MTSTRKTALVAGIFYLITFISIPTLALYGPVKNHRDWILGSGGHTAVLVGGFLEVIVALAGIGTAVTLYPVVKRQNEGVALGFVAARVLEASMIFTGVVSLLSLVTLRQDLGGAAGANAAALVTTGASHVAVYNWTFLLGQSLMPGINALLLGSLLYRSRLVPRIIPVIGLIGAPLLIMRRHRNAVRRHQAASPRGRRSPPSRWLPGSCRWASGWSSRASGPPRSPPQWTPPARRAPTRTSRPDPRQDDTAGPSRRARPCPRWQPVACRWPCCTDAGLTGPGARAGSRQRW